MNHIELFAGCGGLSLGLESEGFDLILANELSPMAGETFAYNHLELNLEEEWDKDADRVFWISSQFPRSDIKSRLKENPYEASASSLGKFSDLKDGNAAAIGLRRSLLIGSITELNAILSKNKKLAKEIQNGLGDAGVDLVSGGPPCQSFSLAGLRQHSNQRNSLPWAFAEFVRTARPKMALLENVSGILRPFKVEGEHYYAWYEVAKAFTQEGYVPLCLHVNAKYCGAAQNRPRFIMLSFRYDIAQLILAAGELEPSIREALLESLDFYEEAKGNPDLAYGKIKYHDVETNADIFSSSIFKPLVSHRNNLVSVKKAIDDLHKTEESSSYKRKSEYVLGINNKSFRNRAGTNTPLKNHELRRNSEKIQIRFGLYQAMNKLTATSRREFTTYLRSGDEGVVSEQAIVELTASGWLLQKYATESKKARAELFLQLAPLRTKKQTQKALFADQPAPAALSIPDDACHYDELQKRTLTVREMARIQSFPDWFEFRSKITTGGQMRKYQVPQYTQVGNAVPPLLGKALGKVCASLLSLGT
jgi:DNA (cytosine-5)-methyltransferase 1